MDSSAGRGGDARKRLLVLTSTFPRWSGDDQPAFVLDLCQRLTAEFRVCVLAPHSAGAATREQMDGITVLRFRYAPEALEKLAYGGGMLGRVRGHPLVGALVPIFLAGQMLAAARTLRGMDVDVVHAHWIVPQGLSAVIACRIARRGTPVVCTSHGGDLFALKGRVATAVKKWVLRRVAQITVVSSSMRDEVLRLLPGLPRVQVMPMGTDLEEQFVPAGPGVARQADELLFVGRLVPKKGIDLVIRVLGRLRKEGARVPRLRIVGSGPEEQALRRLCVELGVADRVGFDGFRPHRELPWLYQRCAMAVFPFREDASGDQEGFGLVVVEALGCGCPVLVADLAPVREVVGHDVVPMLPPDDETAWAAAIKELMSDPGRREQIGLRGRDRVRERFDWTAAATSYAECLGLAAEDQGRE